MDAAAAAQALGDTVVGEGMQAALVALVNAKRALALHLAVAHAVPPGAAARASAAGGEESARRRLGSGSGTSMRRGLRREAWKHWCHARTVGRRTEWQLLDSVARGQLRAAAMPRAMVERRTEREIATASTADAKRCAVVRELQPRRHVTGHLPKARFVGGARRGCRWQCGQSRTVGAYANGA